MGKWNYCRGGCKSREGRHITQPGRRVTSWRRRHLDWVFKESIRVSWSKTSQAEEINSKTKGGGKAGVQDLHTIQVGKGLWVQDARAGAGAGTGGPQGSGVRPTVKGSSEGLRQVKFFHLRRQSYCSSLHFLTTSAYAF